MKRTRRVEIISYRRRVTVTQGDLSAADTPVEERSGDLILDVLGGTPLVPEVGCDELAASEAAADHSPRQRLFFRLGDLLRLRKRK